ncbi:hypothetical protein CDAR_410941 [Caerostris darwini]|uniref:Uncharacterized protein n=1 Tax=Caerostris darwini TaxID=1538125 RepID=A0AAV4SFM2_9ARAC|nr:hypothetical protein CDAR_410941 [Caerostris darwini]
MQSIRRCEKPTAFFLAVASEGRLQGTIFTGCSTECICLEMFVCICPIGRKQLHRLRVTFEFPRWTGALSNIPIRQKSSVMLNRWFFCPTPF